MIGPFMHSKPEGHEIFKNFSFLGRSGVFEDKNGFRLAYLSGKDNDLYENRAMVTLPLNIDFGWQQRAQRCEIY